jgi:transcription termination factor Rho
MTEQKLADLKAKSPTDLLSLAESLEVENASTLRKQDMMFAILRELAERDEEIIGSGVLEVLQDGFGFLRSPESNYLPGPDDIYLSPNQIRKFGLRTGDTIEGPIRAPKDGERYFALLKVNTINFEEPEKARHKVHFDNLTPLYPNERLKMEIEDPTIKDRSARVIDWWRRSERASGDSSWRRRAPARPCFCRTSPTRSSGTTRNVTSSSC